MPKRNFGSHASWTRTSWLKSNPFRPSLQQNLGMHPVNVWPLSRNRSSATSERGGQRWPNKQEKPLQKKPRSGKHGKHHDGTDPAIKALCLSLVMRLFFPATTIATQGQVIWCSKVIDQDGEGASLVRLSVYGTWDPFGETNGPRWSRHQRLHRIAKAHDIDYDKAKDVKDKWAHDRKMIVKIDKLPGRKTLTEGIVKNIMKA